MEIYELTVEEIRERIISRDVSCQEVVTEIFKRIKSVEDRVNAYITLTEDRAIKRAQEIDKKLSCNEKVGSMAGVPVAIKDNMCINGIPNTCGSKHLENFIPPYDATVIEKLYDADAIILGKTNMDEFAMGSSTEYSSFGVTKNPWDLERVPGGSSGGSAAAVAAGQATCAIGSDTGGSIRQPASFCGVVGMKPTYGYVSRYGVVPFSSSLDQVGSLTKNVRDCALLLNVISGKDPRDSTSADIEYPDLLKSLNGSIQGLKIGVAKEYFDVGLASEVKDMVQSGIKVLEECGAEILEVSLPHSEYALPVYYLLAPSEASSNMARYDGVQYGHRAGDSSDLYSLYKDARTKGFGPEVQRRIMLGTYALSAGYYDAYYLKAQKVRTLIRRDFDRAFEKCDCIVSPTSPSTAFKIGAKTDDLIGMYKSDICTVPVNIAGLPGISIPCGIAGGLPVGLQMIGKHFDESTILNMAYAFEQNYDGQEIKGELEVLS